MVFGDPVTGGMFTFWIWFLVAFLLFAIAAYIFNGFAFTAIGRKAKLKTPELAWIPAVGPNLIAFQTAKMHWWPWLMFTSLVISWIPYVGLVVYYIAMLTFGVFSVIWQWKMFEAIKRPGWWALLCLIPFVNFVLVGIAAWSKK